MRNHTALFTDIQKQGKGSITVCALLKLKTLLVHTNAQVLCWRLYQCMVHALWPRYVLCICSNKKENEGVRWHEILMEIILHNIWTNFGFYFLP